MIFHENRLLADDSHEISYLIFFSTIGKDVENFSSAAVVIGALRVNVVSTWIFFIHLDRLEQATKALNDLENQCRDLEQQGATYPELIDKMRADLDQQMQAYKNDVEDQHRKNVCISLS